MNTLKLKYIKVDVTRYVGPQLMEIREALEIGRKRVADRMGMTLSSLYYHENRATGGLRIDFDFIIEYARALGAEGVTLIW